MSSRKANFRRLAKRIAIKKTTGLEAANDNGRYRRARDRKTIWGPHSKSPPGPKCFKKGKGMKSVWS
jgi:hypothetical protein